MERPGAHGSNVASDKHDRDSAGARKRWPEREPRPHDSDALRVYLDVTRAFFVGDREPADWTEQQRLVMQLSTLLGGWFAGGTPGPDTLPALRAAVAAFSLGQTATRYWAVRAVADAGHAFGTAPAEERAVVARLLSMKLGLLDTALFVLGDGADLLSKLEVFAAEPRGKHGKKGPEKVLAEVIVELCPAGALGLEASPDESDEDAIERIRLKLAQDASTFLSSIETAPK